MKIACELPVHYQEKLAPLTDFDFLLTHLVLEDKTYRDFYIGQRALNSRESILDCSIFELGTALSSDKVIEAAHIMNPDVIISPDVLGDHKNTMLNLDAFLTKYGALLEEKGWKVAAVLQGLTLPDIAEAYTYYCSKPLISWICLPFGNILQDMPSLPKDLARMVSRIRVANFLEQSGLVDIKRKHHLLGVNLVSELLFQKAHSWITSADTSAPIVAALTNTELFTTVTKLQRPDNYFEMPYTVPTYNVIAQALTDFRQRLS